MADNSDEFAIIGAGIAGCALAYFLHQQGFKATIFERSPTATFQTEGYTLTIHRSPEVWAELGVDKLILDYFPTIPYETYNSAGDLLFSNSPPEIYHLPRAALRNLILNKLQPGTIQWSKKLLDFQPVKDENGTEKVKLFFADNSTYTYRAVFGCDGFKSKVREILNPEDQLNYLGYVIIYGGVPDEHEYNDKRTQIVDGHSRLFFKPQTPTDSYYAFTFRFDDPEEFQAKFPTQQSFLDEATRLTKDWHPKYTESFQKTRPDTILGSLLYDKLPISYGKGYVTLLGDSAHPMSPLKGQGATTAMVNALYISRSLRKHFPNVKEAIQEYEDNMYPNAADKVRASRDAVHFYHQASCLDGNEVRKFTEENNALSL